MSIASLLHPKAVLVAPRVEDKWELLSAMVDQMIEAGLFGADLREDAHAALVERERSMSTGMEAGIAIPHAAMDGIESLAVAIALLPDGLEFGSLDGAPTHIAVCLMVPKREKLAHIRTLAEVARRLGDPEFRDALVACTTGDQAVALW